MTKHRSLHLSLSLKLIIYFDNEELDFLFENIEGHSNRRKIRIRWYGECFGNINANLEYKIKNGNVGYKEIFKDIKFDLSEDSKLKYLLLLLLTHT